MQIWKYVNYPLPSNKMCTKYCLVRNNIYWFFNVKYSCIRNRETQNRIKDTFQKCTTSTTMLCDIIDNDCNWFIDKEFQDENGNLNFIPNKLYFYSWLLY